LYIYTYMFMYTYVYIHVNIFEHIHMQTYIYICTYTYVYIYIYTHTCIHIYVYMYTHLGILMYIYTYTYVCTPRSSARQNPRYKFSNVSTLLNLLHTPTTKLTAETFYFEDVDFIFESNVHRGKSRTPPTDDFPEKLAT